MTLTVAKLQAWRDSLVEAQLSGIRELEDQNGERIVYRSGAEMARAIGMAEAEIAKLAGRPKRTTLKFKTTKGL